MEVVIQPPLFMKRILFIIFIAGAAVLLISFVSTFFYNITKLTEYGYGVLAGRAVLLIVFIILAYITRPKRK